jgi:hypothetical protein
MEKILYNILCDKLHTLELNNCDLYLRFWVPLHKLVPMCVLSLLWKRKKTTSRQQILVQGTTTPQFTGKVGKGLKTEVKTNG